jgi:hypothetical protein
LACGERVITVRRRQQRSDRATVDLLKVASHNVHATGVGSNGELAVVT